MPTNDIEKNRRYRREWYARNKDRQIARQTERKKEVTAYIRSLRVACIACGESDPACLDFHHLEPTEKEVNIGLAVRSGWGIVRLEAEIQKCVVWCSNCHRKHHFYQRPESQRRITPDRPIGKRSGGQPTPTQHGSERMYSAYGCRCDLCRAGRAARRKQRIATKEGRS